MLDSSFQFEVWHSLFNLSPLPCIRPVLGSLMVFVFFLLSIFVVTNVDFLAWQASRLEFTLMLDMLRLFIHARHVKTNYCFYAGHCKVMLGM